MRELQENTLVAFVSDSHIGGDPGCDGFESPGELEALFAGLRGHDGPVELVLAGDFFDFLQISSVPEGTNRASATIARPEYAALFEALRRFRSAVGKRVIYLPGNHDAEGWWNPEIGRTLVGEGLVDELAYHYLASVEVGGERKVVYCEHGNQLDPANTIEDYRDRLDTPLGHHVVTDFTRRVAPFGEVSAGLDLSEIKNVYPLVAIPAWVASRYFYYFAGKVVRYLLLPLLLAYAVYRALTYSLASRRGEPASLFGGPVELAPVHELFVDLAAFGVLVLLVSALFFLAVRHALHRVLAGFGPGGRPYPSPAETSQNRVRAILRGEQRAPMNPSLDPATVDVFVSGHTHLPSLAEVERPARRSAVMVNSGCWLRQLHPVPPRLKGPPVFVSEYVLTHVRIFARDAELRVELWEQPKPARQRLSRLERLLSWGRRPPQPSPRSEPRLRAASVLRP